MMGIRQRARIYCKISAYSLLKIKPQHQFVQIVRVDKKKLGFLTLKKSSFYLQKVASH